jgi:integrase
MKLASFGSKTCRSMRAAYGPSITPEAGTVKSNTARLVPLHPHLVEQGFLSAISGKGEGPLFYEPARQRVEGDASRHFKKVGERLAQWVRKDVGITDPTLQPNHGWRHTFKTGAMVAGIPERIADYIQGHAPKSVGQAYGSVPLGTAAAEIGKLPRFDVDARLASG